MRTPSGLVELDSGWWIAVGSPAWDQVRMELHFDPRANRAGDDADVKDLRLSADETIELVEALVMALGRARMQAEQRRW